MKKILLSLLFIFSIIQLKAQNFEIAVQANSGLSHYSGAQFTDATFLNADAANHTGYSNGFGDRNAVTYGAGAQFQYVFKSDFILGSQVGYEVVSTKVNINGVYGIGNGETAATGSSTLHNQYFLISPFIGYRFLLNSVKFDVLPGIDIALGTGSHESGKVNASDGTVFNINNDYGKPYTDIRLRLGVAAYYQKFGITASYSRGYNHTPDELSDSIVPSMHSEIFRLGLSYRIK